MPGLIGGHVLSFDPKGSAALKVFIKRESHAYWAREGLVIHVIKYAAELHDWRHDRICRGRSRLLCGN